MVYCGVLSNRVLQYRCSCVLRAGCQSAAVQQCWGCYNETQLHVEGLPLPFLQTRRWGWMKQLLMMLMVSKKEKGGGGEKKRRRMKRWVTSHQGVNLQLGWNKQPLFMLITSLHQREQLSNGSKVGSEEITWEFGYKLKRWAHKQQHYNIHPFCPWPRLQTANAVLCSPHWDSYQRARGGKRKKTESCNKHCKEKLPLLVLMTRLFCFFLHGL